MRRKEKEIIERSELEAVISRSVVCRLGMSDGNLPYILPLCFGFSENVIYVHGSLEGRKIEILRKNPNVCVEFDTDVEIVEAASACNWGMRYRSVIGFGKAVIVENPNEKRSALDIIMNQYTDRAFSIPDEKITGTTVIKIEIERLTGKQSGVQGRMNRRS